MRARAALTVKDQIRGQSRYGLSPWALQQAEGALRQCLALGADDAVLVTDRAFGGADTLAINYTIASAIRHIQRTMNRQFQIIFCGKQAIDGGSSTGGPQIARGTRYGAKLPYACEFSRRPSLSKAIVKREHENGYEVVEAPLPLLVTTTAELNEPRQPGPGAPFTRNDILLIILPCVICLNVMKAALALPVPPTRVRKVYQPPLRGKVEMLSSVDEAPKRCSNWRTILSLKSSHTFWCKMTHRL